jgi:hypothetical protein
MNKKYFRLGFSRSEVDAIIFAIAVVSIWRGVWLLMDRYLFPESQTISGVASIIIGLLIIWLTDNSLKGVV